MFLVHKLHLCGVAGTVCLFLFTRAMSYFNTTARRTLLTGREAASSAFSSRASVSKYFISFTEIHFLEFLELDPLCFQFLKICFLQRWTKNFCGKLLYRTNSGWYGSQPKYDVYILHPTCCIARFIISTLHIFI